MPNHEYELTDAERSAIRKREAARRLRPLTPAQHLRLVTEHQRMRAALKEIASGAAIPSGDYWRRLAMGGVLEIARAGVKGIRALKAADHG